MFKWVLYQDNRRTRLQKILQDESYRIIESRAWHRSWRRTYVFLERCCRSNFREDKTSNYDWRVRQKYICMKTIVRFIQEKVLYRDCVNKGRKIWIFFFLIIVLVQTLLIIRSATKRSDVENVTVLDKEKYYYKILLSEMISIKMQNNITSI